MPHQADFRHASATLRGALDWMATSRRHVDAARTTDTIAGGTVAVVATTALDISLIDHAATALHISALAELCDRRAVICAHHEYDLAVWGQRYERWERAIQRWRTTADDPTTQVPWPGPAPVRPVAPFAWVEPS